jgi:serine/threonine protein phosphatase PrpC
MHNQDVSRLVLDAAGRSFLTSARELCAEAMILGSTDNVTALVVDLRYAVSQAVQSL